MMIIPITLMVVQPKQRTPMVNSDILFILLLKITNYNYIADLKHFKNLIL